MDAPTKNALAARLLESMSPVGENRDDWSSEDKEQEAHLLNEWSTAWEALFRELEAHKQKLDEWNASVRAAQELGRSEAEHFFGRFGPQRGA